MTTTFSYYNIHVFAPGLAIVLTVLYFMLDRRLKGWATSDGEAARRLCNTIFALHLMLIVVLLSVWM